MMQIRNKAKQKQRKYRASCHQFIANEFIAILIVSTQAVIYSSVRQQRGFEKNTKVSHLIVFVGLCSLLCHLTRPGTQINRNACNVKCECDYSSS